MRTIEIPVSVGELLDRLSILEVKGEKYGGDPGIQGKIEAQRLGLLQSVGMIGIASIWYDKLLDTNRQLWELEDAIRFSKNPPTIAVLAQKIIALNDQRSLIKTVINKEHNSPVEEKLYT